MSAKLPAPVRCKVKAANHDELKECFGLVLAPLAVTPYAGELRFTKDWGWSVTYIGAGKGSGLRVGPTCKSQKEAIRLMRAILAVLPPDHKVWKLTAKRPGSYRFTKAEKAAYEQATEAFGW